MSDLRHCGEARYPRTRLRRWRRLLRSGLFVVDVESSRTYRRLWRAFVGAETNGKALRDLVHDPSRPDYTVLAHRSLAAAFAGPRYGDGGPALLLLQVGPV